MPLRVITLLRVFYLILLIMFDFPIHSPVQRLHFNVPDGFELYIKRDDLIDPLISGNKWRKLKYSLQDAKQKNKSILVSFGGAYSNHLLALASAAAKFGFQSVGFIRGDEKRDASVYCTLYELFGMQLIPLSREEYKHKTSAYQQHYGQNEQAYFIDEGGRSALGSLGCEEIMDELDTTYDAIFLAAGTGCTSAGILNAIHKKQLATHLHVVAIHKGFDDIFSSIKELSLDVYPIPDTQYSIHHSTTRYAQHTKELLLFCLDIQKHTGILIEPIYTAKALQACYDWMKEQKKEEKIKKILFLHTGGMLGNLGKIDAFSNLFNENKS